MLQFSENRTFLKKDAKRLMTLLRSINILAFPIEEASGTLI
jgi:hypothetical protein